MRAALWPLASATMFVPTYIKVKFPIHSLPSEEEIIRNTDSVLNGQSHLHLLASGEHPGLKKKKKELTGTTKHHTLTFQRSQHIDSLT